MSIVLPTDLGVTLELGPTKGDITLFGVTNGSDVVTTSGGLYRYRYVLSTERYSSQPLEQVSVTVTLRSSSGLASLYSSSHPIKTERLGSDRARVTWEAQNANPAQDFELFFAPAEGGFGGGLLTGQRDAQGHFLFLFAPDLVQAGEGAISKDIVFVIDRSGSMSFASGKIVAARNAAGPRLATS